jgi:hypothetical protein
MANSLYQAILDRVRKITRPKAPTIPGRTPTLGLPRQTSSPTSPQPAPGTDVIPFAPGRIYRAAYTNYKNDPRPLIFILSSDAFYTHAINIHYLGGLQNTMLRAIKNMRDTNKPLTGLIMYQFLKQRTPAIPQLAYRMYFTKYLKGKLVSDGVSQNPLPGKAKFVMDPFIRRLNKMIQPDPTQVEKLSHRESEALNKSIDVAETKADQIIAKRRL